MGKVVRMNKSALQVIECEFFRIDYLVEDDKRQHAIIKTKLDRIRPEDILYVIVNCFDCDIHQVDIYHLVIGKVVALHTIPQLM